MHVPLRTEEQFVTILEVFVENNAFLDGFNFLVSSPSVTKQKVFVLFCYFKCVSL